MAAEIGGGLFFTGFLFAVLFPFSGAYAIFCYCYWRKLCVTEKPLAQVVAAVFSIIPALIIVTAQVGHRYWFEDLGCGFVATPMYKALSELNYRENWRWADVLESGRQFQTDSELDREIVHGKTLGGWNLDLGSKFIWTKGPTATGGTISYQYNKTIVLYRTPATLKESATWRWSRRKP